MPDHTEEFRQVCRWCDNPYCDQRWEHSRFHGNSETTWRELTVTLSPLAALRLDGRNL